VLDGHYTDTAEYYRLQATFASRISNVPEQRCGYPWVSQQNPSVFYCLMMTLLKLSRNMSLNKFQLDKHTKTAPYLCIFASQRDIMLNPLASEFFLILAHPVFKM
jgi:hypothetical protein